MTYLSSAAVDQFVRAWKTVFTPARSFAGLKIAFFGTIAAMTFGMKIEADWTRKYLKVDMSEIDYLLFVSIAGLVCVLLVLDLWMWHRTSKAAEQHSQRLIDLLKDPNISVEIKLRIITKLS